jgi:hypothetical protein
MTQSLNISTRLKLYLRKLCTDGILQPLINVIFAAIK